MSKTSLLVIGKELFSGVELVAIIAIVAAGLIIYFAFVFGRIASIKAKISETEKQIEVEAGKKV